MTAAALHRGSTSFPNFRTARFAARFPLPLASAALVLATGFGLPAFALQEAEPVVAAPAGQPLPDCGAMSPDAVAPAPATAAQAAPGTAAQAAPVAPVPPAAPVDAAPPSEAPKAPPAPPAEAAGPQLEFTPFDDKLFLEARRNGSPIGLYFEADWCHPCREMHARTLRDPAVLKAAEGFRLFRVDLTRPGGYVELVEKSFRIIGSPTVVFFGPDGKERSRRFGFVPPADFAHMLDEARKPAPAS